MLCNYVHSWAVLSHRAHSVKIHGTQYKSGAVIRTKSSQSDVSQFEYARIEEIYVYHDHKIMVTSLIQIVSIISHLRAFKINVTDQVVLYHMDQLYCHGVLHLKQRGPNTYLVEKDNWVNPIVY